MLSPRQYGEKHGKPQTTVATWLKKGLIPGAEKIETPTGIMWAIPENTPLPDTKMGRPPKPKEEAVPKKARKKK